MNNYFLDLHKRLCEQGKLSGHGLCFEVEKHTRVFNLLTPTADEFEQLVNECLPTVFWGRGTWEFQYDDYTPLRQTIVLFCHEILNSK